MREATGAELELADFKLTSGSEHMGRHLNVEGLKKLLDENIEHPCGISGGTLPVLRQLHHGVSHLLLLDGDRRDRFG